MSAETDESGLSVEEYLNNDDYNLAEYDRGRLIWMLSVSTAHSRVVTRLSAAFVHMIGDKCVVLGEPAKLKLFEKQDLYLMPDIMVVCKESDAKILPMYVSGTPKLVVEALSQSTIKNDRIKKMNYYLKAGVPEYWIVDIGNEVLEIYLLKNGKYKYDLTVFENGETVNIGMFEGLTVSDIFRNVLA
jgi:Uma2 family endonuclease